MKTLALIKQTRANLGLGTENAQSAVFNALLVGLYGNDAATNAVLAAQVEPTKEQARELAAMARQAEPLKDRQKRDADWRARPAPLGH